MASKQACALCGKDPAEGFATIDDKRYCHEGPDPTCYMRASWDIKAEWLPWPLEKDGGRG